MKIKSIACFLFFLLPVSHACGEAIEWAHGSNYDIVLYTNHVEEPVYIVCGTRTMANPYGWIIDGKWATYEITEVTMAGAPTGVIYVCYAKESIREPLPSQAILIVVSTGIDNVYNVIGEEAWRGIYADTIENRKRLLYVSLDDAIALARAAPITLDAAMGIAAADIAKRGQEIVGRTVMAARGPYGWTLHVWIRNATAASFALPSFIDVRDEGYVFQTVIGQMPMDVDAILEASPGSDLDTSSPSE